MAIKSYPVSWVGVYKASSNRYNGGSNLLAGGSNRYNTYVGIPTAVKDAIKTSKTPAKLRMRMNVTNAGEFDFGGHRETYNKASGTMPWYRYLGLHPIYSVGWKETDLTSAFMSEYLKGNYHGVVLYGGSDQAEAYGKTGNANQATFIVEGTWNNAPTAPATVSSPKSSTVVDNEVLFSWSASTDIEKTSGELSYQVEYYDGSKWGDTKNVGAGTLSYNYLLKGKPETSSARLRVRSYDGDLYSGWTYSPIFTLTHNLPPSKPTNLTPSGGKVINSAQNLRATWRHNDNGVQAGYRIAWRTVSATGVMGAYNYIPSATEFANSTSQYHDFSANTFPLGEIEWRVATKDQQGETSPESSNERFYAGVASNAPIWLNPKSGALWNSSEVIAQWSSLDQEKYEIKLLAGATVLWEESAIASNKSTRVGYALENNMTYKLSLRVTNRDSGLWSNWSEVTFTTKFVAPATPVVTLMTEEEDGSNLENVVINWDTDNPATATLTEFVRVYRREYNATVAQDWQLIGDNRAPDSSMIDYSPASEQTYEYMVRAWGANDTLSESNIIEAEVILTHSFLQRALSPSDLLVIDAEEREESFDFGGELMKFANREKPVFEHGVNELRELPIAFSIDSIAELRNAIAFIKLRETFLYRDNAGRRFYCVIRQPKVTDKIANGFEISLLLSEVDFIEETQGG